MAPDRRRVTHRGPGEDRQSNPGVPRGLKTAGMSADSTTEASASERTRRTASKLFNRR